jgi:hypothetical protein
MKRTFSSILACLAGLGGPGIPGILIVLLCGFTLQGDDFFYKLNKGIDVYGRV